MKTIHQLEKLILKHKSLYYEGNPEISDYEYDQIEEELKKIDPNNFTLKLVGHGVKSENKIEHDKKMLSLDKTYDIEQLSEWVKKYPAISMYKLDGVSGSLLYSNGHLIKGKTRGDGSFGEDITAKTLWIESIPKKIPFLENVEIRGELYCTEESFYRLSGEMEKRGLEKPASQRNIVAGLISRKDDIDLCRYLSFMAFDFIEEHVDTKFESEKFTKLEKSKFIIPEITFHKDDRKLKEVISSAQEFMIDGEYQIDGIVFSYNEILVQEELGETAHHPRYKIAYKFRGDAKETYLKKIEWSISRNGYLTPVGIVEPVELSGAIINRVTLHNFGMVKQHQLKAGDKIKIIRSGEVIPKFLEVIESYKGEIEIPDKCPSCGLEVQEKEIRLVCENQNCTGQIKESILNYIKKIGIDDLSSKRLEELIQAGLVKGIADLYRLTKEQLLTMDKVQDKLATKLLLSIQKSKTADLKKFLSALGIQGGAYNKCEKVVDNGFDTIDKIKNLTMDKLVSVDSFADKSATDFVKSLNSKMNLIDELINLGFSFENGLEKNSAITGKKICITGALTEKRAVIEARVREFGGIMMTSVGKNTDYLVTNENDSASSKYVKAKSLGVKIISEEELKKLMS